MPLKCETPPKSGASRNSFAGLFRDTSNPVDVQTQRLIRRYHVRTELASLIASFAFGEGNGDD